MKKKTSIIFAVFIVISMLGVLIWKQNESYVYAGSDGAWDASIKAANKADSLLNKGSYIDGNDFLRDNVQDTFYNLVGETLWVVHQGSRSKLTICSDGDSIEIRGRVSIDTIISSILKMGTAYEFPTVDGDDGQVIKTDGSGSLSWESDNVGEVGGGTTAGEVSDSCDNVRSEIPDSIDAIRSWTAIIGTIDVYDDDTQPRLWSDIGDTCDAHISLDSIYFLYSTDWTSEGWLLNTDTIKVDTSSAGGVMSGEVGDSCNVVRSEIPDSIDAIRSWTAIIGTIDVYDDDTQPRLWSDIGDTCDAHISLDSIYFLYSTDWTSEGWLLDTDTIKVDTSSVGGVTSGEVSDSCDVVRGGIPDSINSIRSWPAIGDTCDAHDTNTQLSWSDVGDTTEAHISLDSLYFLYSTDWTSEGWLLDTDTIKVDTSSVGGVTSGELDDSCNVVRSEIPDSVDVIRGWTAIIDTSKVYCVDEGQVESITELMLNSENAPTDEWILSYELTGSKHLQWKEMVGGGDANKSDIGESCNVVRGEIPDSIDAIRSWTAIIGTIDVYDDDTQPRLWSDIGDTCDAHISLDSIYFLHSADWTVEGWLLDTDTIKVDTSSAGEIGDSCNVVRGEIPDSASSIAGDTANVLRTEMIDSANVVVADTADQLRSEIGDSAKANCFDAADIEMVKVSHMFTNEIGPTDEWILSYEQTGDKFEWVEMAGGVTSGEVGDSCDVVRGEMPDSAKGVAGDSARSAAGDTANMLRAEMPDSAKANCFDDADVEMIYESHLFTDDIAPTDEWVLSYEATGPKFEWVEMTGGSPPDSSWKQIEVQKILPFIDDTIQVGVDGNDTVKMRARLEIHGDVDFSMSQANIYIRDNQATSIQFLEDVNPYLTFITSDGSEKIQTNKPLNISGSYTLPTSDGSVGQNLITDGSGSVSWDSDTLQSIFTIPNDGDWDNETYPIWIAPLCDVTIVQVNAAVMGSATPILTYNIEERAWGALASAGTDIYASDQTADTDGEKETSFSNAGISAEAHLVLTTGTGAESGTVDLITGTIYYIKHGY